MKLNFWQWLGVALLVLAGVLYYLEYAGGSKPAAQPAAPSTMPAE